MKAKTDLADFNDVFDLVIKQKEPIEVLGQSVLGQESVYKVLSDLVDILVRDDPDWEYKYIAEEDEKVDSRFPANRVIPFNEWKKLMGKAADIYTPDTVRGKLKDKLDISAFAKLLKFRLIGFSTVRPEDTDGTQRNVFKHKNYYYSENGFAKGNLKEFLNALDRIVEYRNQYLAHKSGEILELTGDRALEIMQEMRKLVSGSLDQVEQRLLRGEECKKVLEEYVNKLDVLIRAYTLSREGVKVEKDETKRYSWRDIYAHYNFIAYPAFESDKLSDFMQSLCKGKNPVFVDEGTKAYSLAMLRRTGNELMEKRRRRIKNFLRAMKNEMEIRSQEIPVIKIPDYSMSSYDTHFAKPFADFLENQNTFPPGSKVCVITDNSYLARLVWALDNPDIVALKVVDSNTVRPFFGLQEEEEPDGSMVFDMADGDDESAWDEHDDENVMDGDEGAMDDAENAVDGSEIFEDAEHVDDIQLGQDRTDDRESRPQEESALFIPREYSNVLLDRKLWTLRHKISSGGEGSVYEVDDGNLCVKIYNNPTPERQKKLERMLNMRRSFVDNDRSTVCWPTEVIRHTIEPHDIIGYAMKRVRNAKPLDEIILDINTGANEWEWNRNSLVEVCLRIVDTLKTLHSAKDEKGAPRILMGDISEKNIMVTKDLHVYFIDTDSYQVDDMLCTVGTPEFVSPRLYRNGCQFSKVERRLSDEEYAMTCLLFYILFLGDTPFDQSGDRTLKECVINKIHKLGDPYDYTLKNLTDGVRNAFMETFCVKKPDHEQTFFDWYELLCEMQDEILKERLSNKLYPTSALEGADDQFVQVKCRRCGDKFETTRMTQEKAREFDEPDLCPGCKGQRREARAKIIRMRCKSCGRTYTVNLWDRENEMEKSGESSASALKCPDCKGGVKVPRRALVDKDPQRFLRGALFNMFDAEYYAKEWK